MKKVFALIAFMGVIALAACGSTGGGDGGESCGGGCGGDGGSSKMDSTQSTIDMYLNGTMKASYWVQLHENPEAGQYWETTMEMSGMVMTTRWQIAAKDGDTVVVEHQSKMDSEYAVSDYVVAYQVDTTKGMGEANVTAAWIGKPGEKGQEIEVMEVPEATCGGCGGTEPETEEFSGLELAGGTWEGTIYINGGSRTWMASNGWFGGMIKTETDGTTGIVLSSFGTDAEPLLAWE